jgi:hypothetical protein
MPEVFGTKFIITNTARQVLNPKIFGGGPWTHLATVVRGFRTYMAFTKVNDPTKTYIEIVDEHSPGVFIRIEDDEEWRDVYMFMKTAGLFSMENFHYVKSKT